MFDYFKRRDYEDGVIYRNRVINTIKEINDNAFIHTSSTLSEENLNKLIDLATLMKMSRPWNKDVIKQLPESEKVTYIAYPISRKADDYEYYINYRFFNGLSPDDFLANEELMKKFYNLRLSVELIFKAEKKMIEEEHYLSLYNFSYSDNLPTREKKNKRGYDERRR